MNKDMMRELSDSLAFLKAQHKKIIDARESDPGIVALSQNVAKLRIELDDMVTAMELARSEDAPELKGLEREIAEVENQILCEWDHDSKTLVCGDNVLQFRTTYAQRIYDSQALMVSLIKTLPPKYVSKYVRNYNLTELKQWIKTFPQPDDIMGLVTKTTVKLEVT